MRVSGVGVGYASKGGQIRPYWAGNIWGKNWKWKGRNVFQTQGIADAKDLKWKQVWHL